MKLIVLFLLSLGVVIPTGCAPTYPPIIYSTDIEGIADHVLIDGVPEGVTIANINDILLRKIDRRLTSFGLKGSDREKVNAVYEITYLGHKFMPPRAKYIIKYHFEIRNKGKVIYSTEQESFSSDLGDLTDEIAEDIVKYVLEKGQI